MNRLYKKLKTIVGNPGGSEQNIVSPDQISDNPKLINGLNQTIFQINDSGQWTYLNAEWEKLTGFSITQTLGTDIMDYIHPDDKKQCADFFQNIYKNNPQSSSIKIRFLTRDAHLCWVNMRANSFTDPVDNKLHLIGVISDITERVREYGLHQANYRTLYTLINNLCGLVYRGRNDRAWTMEFVSEGCLDLTGYKPSDMVNKTVTFGSLINLNDQELVWTNVQFALAGNRPYEINYRIRTRNGDEKWVWERGKGNFSSNGELLSIEGLIVDITDYKKNKIKKNEEILYKTKSRQPQKYLFIDRLDQAVLKHSSIKDYKFALLLLHIDRFNKLQERHSADIIEKIILDVCERLGKTINNADSLCLFGDGEFGILLEHIGSVNTITKVIKQIKHELLEPVLINDVASYLTLSIGASISSNNSKDRKLIIQDAYSALSRAKSLGGSRYDIFDEEINAHMYALDRMENEIHYALENKELLICYQPVVCLKENAISGLEAQLFWNHPRRGKIPAKTFAAVEADDEIVSQLNQWITTTTAHQIQSWATGTDLKQNLCFIIIQLCGEKIVSDSFLHQLEQLSGHNKYNKSKLLIKLPENAVHLISSENIETINGFIKQNIGFTVSMDNPSSPPDKEILRLQLNSIQLNNISSIENHNDLLFTKAQIDYIHTMGMKVIISGVDTKEQLDMMQGLGCDYIQGDIISPPLENEDLAQFITDDKHCSFLPT